VCQAVRLDVGHERERVEGELRGLSCTPVHNPEYAAGMNTSLRAGIRALPEDVGGAVVLLGDMPLVDASMVRALVDLFRREQPPLAISTYDGVVAPPILYGRARNPRSIALRCLPSTLVVCEVVGQFESDRRHDEDTKMVGLDSQSHRSFVFLRRGQ